MNKKYIIIPGCSDLNRGDQALVWETKRLAEENGFNGHYYLTAEENEPVSQSQKFGIKIVRPIMEHPSRIFKTKSNINYSIKLKIKWGIVSIFDFIISLLYLTKPTRSIIKKLISSEKKKSIEIMEQSDAFFVKGGGLLQTYGGLTSTYSMYFWCYHIFLAHSLDKPVYVMPNSYGPFKGPLVKKIAGRALKCCKVITSRESLSTDMVYEQLGLKINTYPDLAFNLPMSQLSKEDIFSQYKIPQNRKLVAITMRPYRFPNSDNPKESYETFQLEMEKFIDWLYIQGYMAIIVEHTLAVNEHENDGACIKNIIRNLPEEEYRLITDKNYDCYDLKRIYSFCDYIVGTRFHSVIFSLGNNIPAIAICYVGNKGQGIMHDIGLDDYAISIYDVRSDVLEKKFSALIENRDEVLKKISLYNNNVQDKHSELIQMCKDSCN